MPTGGGKSLTYQFPALVREGIAVIISPLISLMKDQVDTLEQLWVRAELINSTLSPEKKRSILQELCSADHDIKFLYIAPERLNSQEFIDVLKQTKISLLAIDEAHCISQWGHDFRPSYMKIQAFIELLQSFGEPFPIIWLTATATQQVREDIVERLWLKKYKEFISGFDRKNLVIVVREISEKTVKQEKVREIIHKTPGVWIIYCSSRKHVMELSEYLLSEWIKTGIYKWDLSAEKREEEQNKFMNDEYKVIVATNAFGMGIDKKDIRFVIHYNLPGSIENYYQEIGRAGRDGKQSYAIVLASYGDIKIQEFFIENSYPERKIVGDFYGYLYKDFALSQWKGAKIAKTYHTMAEESGLWKDMLIASIITLLEKYDILQRWMQRSAEDIDFHGRGLTLLQEKRNFIHSMIDWKQQDLLKNESYFKLEQIKRLLFYPSCRKRYILEYFWDETDLEKMPENCGLCDYCLESGSMSEEDKKKYLPASSYSMILEIVKKYDERFGQGLLVKVLIWSKDARISQWNLDSYENYWALEKYDTSVVSAMFDALIMDNYLLKTEGKYPCVGITQLWKGALYRNIYIVQNLADLNSFVIQKNKNTAKKPTTSWGNLKKKIKGETQKETLALFQSEKNLNKISKQRGLKLQTIEEHIVQLYLRWDIALMNILDIVELKDAKKVQAIVSSWSWTEELGWKQLKEMLQNEGNSISYFHIKLTLAMIEKWDL